jgi:GlpG protein
MYKIGELSDPMMADLIVQDLTQKGIASKLVEEQGLLAIYVEKENDREKAFDMFRVRLGFAPRYEIPEEFKKMASIPWGTMTPVFIALSLAISFAMLTTGGKDVASLWFFSQEETQLFEEIKSGQWWRLWSPIFLHFGLLHIIFNMLVFKDFGPLIEHQHGLKRALIWIAAIALFSNVAQYLVQGPQFGGMSGVLFGMLGIIWTYKVFNPESEFSLPKSSVTMLLVWFFMCLFGLIPNIANTAHAVGLTVGMLIGIFLGENDRKISDAKDNIPFTKRFLFILLAIGLSLLTLAVEAWKLDGKLFFYA